MTESATEAAMLAARKLELRRSLRATRAGLSRTLVAQRSSLAADRLLALPALVPARTVALFAAIESERELDPRAADAALRARGQRTVYPRVAQRRPPRLAFHAVDDAQALVAGPFGVPEPDPGSVEVALEQIDAFVVPGVAYTTSGARLGYGGGYYDATLAAAPHALRIGYTHPEQLVDALPESAADERVDHLVTSDLTLTCAPRRAAAPGASP